MRSGYVHVNYGYLRTVGINGYYWSHSGILVTNAYLLTFDASEAYPSRGPYNRYYGFSLRCLQE